MCVIIIGTKKNVSKEEVMRAWLTNSDGFGMLIKNKIHKGLKLTSLLKYYKELKDNEKFILWCRISTGGYSLQPCPLGNGLYLFHNGICGKSEGMLSDTAILARSIYGMNINDIKEYLTLLNRLNKGKFVVADLKTVNFWQTGLNERNGVYRSNENHLPYFSEEKKCLNNFNKFDNDKYTNFK